MAKNRLRPKFKIISGKHKKSENSPWETEEGRETEKNESDTPTEGKFFTEKRADLPTDDPLSSDTMKEETVTTKNKENPFKKDRSTVEIENAKDRPDPPDVSEEAKNNPFAGTIGSSSSNKNTSSRAGSDSKAIPNNKSTSESRSTPNTETTLIIDEDYTYFFVFGLTTAGKSAMLSGLIRYMSTSGIGMLRPQGSEVHQKRGRYLIDKMLDKVEDGDFVEGTPTLNSQNADLVTEINLLFEPNYPKLPDLKFCLLEMAGEDLKSVEIQEGGVGGSFDRRIEAFLTHPDCELMFICVVDVDFPKESQKAIANFLDYLYEVGHHQNPVLLTVNKWDKVKDEFGDVEIYLRVKLPVVMNKLHDKNRIAKAYLDFSIGDVDIVENKFDFKEKDSKRLFKWIYSQATGKDFVFSEPGEHAPSRGKSKGFRSWWQKTVKRS